GKTPGLILATEKLDGISVDLQYDNGKLIQGSTRGDGETGENITRNVRRMKGAVPTINNNGLINIRGEIVIKHSDLDKFPDITNARNGASGAAKRISGDGV